MFLAINCRVQARAGGKGHLGAIRREVWPGLKLLLCMPVCMQERGYMFCTLIGFMIFTFIVFDTFYYLFYISLFRFNLPMHKCLFDHGVAG